MTGFWKRIWRAAKLDPHLYEEVEADPKTLPQAMGAVLLSSAAAGVGAVSLVGLGGLLAGAIAALISWFLWALITYGIGAKLLPEPQTHADLGQLLRTIGFSSSPGMIRILGVIPGLGPLVFPAAGIWMLIAMVVAVRQALDYSSTFRAAAVCLLGWIVQGILLASLLLLSKAGQPS